MVFQWTFETLKWKFCEPPPPPPLQHRLIVCKLLIIWLYSLYKRDSEKKEYTRKGQKVHNKSILLQKILATENQFLPV